MLGEHVRSKVTSTPKGRVLHSDISKQTGSSTLGPSEQDAKTFLISVQ